MPIAIFINGVFEDPLNEILAAQSNAPAETFFLQPGAGKRIKLLAESNPTRQSPIELYVSLINSLAFVSFRAKIVGWRDKREISETDREQLNLKILQHQPAEKEVWLTVKENKLCVNLIYIAELERLKEPIPVSCFVKVSNRQQLKQRTTAGGWAYVYTQPNWLGDSSTAVDIDVIQALKEEVEKSLKGSAAARQDRLATAPKKPEVIQVLARAFRRNADVIAEALSRANGKCEQCYANGPFFRASDGTRYLEVHHRLLLSLGGDDTVENAIALCPNCHREFHFGQPDIPA